MREFTNEEIKGIIKGYTEKISTVKLSKTFKTSPKKIKEVLLNNGIDIHDPNKSVGCDRKPNNFWEDKDNVYNAMKECRSRREFSQRFCRAYNIARKNGWYEEMANNIFKKDDVFNNYNAEIHIVYAYEFKDLNYVYIGRTLDIKRRHREHAKNEKDSVCKFIKKHSCKLPEVKILEKNLTAENSQIQENFWLEDYLRRKWSIINISPTGLNKSSLGGSFRKWNYEKCQIAASKCKSKEDFKNKFVGAYNISRKYGWIYDFFNFNLKKNNGCFDTFEQCIEEIKKFKTLGEIRKQYPFLYQKICKNKWNDKVREILGYKPKQISKKVPKSKNSIVENEFELLDVDFKKLTEKEFIFYHMIYAPSVNIFPKILNTSKQGEQTIFVIENKKIAFIIIGVDKFRNKKIDIKNMDEYSTHIIYDCEIEPMDFKLTSKIDSILNVRKEFGYGLIDARKCKIGEICSHCANEFLKNNHIQGECNSTIYLGATYNDVLVGVMTFKNGTLTNREWELTRFATDIHYIVRGLGSKMFNYFTKHYNVNNVISFADRRWTSSLNNLYSKMGFEFCHITPPSYKYLSINNTDTKLYNKFGFRKQVLLRKHPDILTPEMTETEMVKKLGYDRIWDCGLIKYVWKKPEE